jgi:hypothetical protein
VLRRVEGTGKQRGKRGMVLSFIWSAERYDGNALTGTELELALHFGVFAACPEIRMGDALYLILNSIRVKEVFCHLQQFSIHYSFRHSSSIS